jgi:hypothetical protein
MNGSIINSRIEKKGWRRNLLHYHMFNNETRLKPLRIADGDPETEINL